jgi:hypothetical protein
MALKPPVEVPQGAIRLNTDSQKLEFFAQDQWWEMATEVAMPIGGRGVNAGGITPSATNDIQYISMETGGKSFYFGDLTNVLTAGSSGSSRTRGIFFGGYTQGQPSWSMINVIDYVTIATAGNATDFGDQITSTIWPAQGIAGNNTRGIKAGGTSNPAVTNVIQYVTITSTGNATDFGDLTGGTQVSSGAGVNSATRTVFSGGGPATAPSTTVYNSMEYITIATTGNGVNFGDLTFAGRHFNGVSNATRGIVAGGWQNPAGRTTLQVFQIASTGNTSDFGDLNTALAGAAACSNQIRGFFFGGGNVIQTTNIQTLGNAYSWGELDQGSMNQSQAVSNAHGGL